VVREWYCGEGYGTPNFFSTRNDSSIDTEKRELWDRLANEPERACRAFECFLTLPSGPRTILEVTGATLAIQRLPNPPIRGAMVERNQKTDALGCALMR
jgi:hypothetical protein